MGAWERRAIPMLLERDGFLSGFRAVLEKFERSTISIQVNGLSRSRILKADLSISLPIVYKRNRWKLRGRV